MRSQRSASLFLSDDQCSKRSYLILFQRRSSSSGHLGEVEAEQKCPISIEFIEVCDQSDELGQWPEHCWLQSTAVAFLLDFFDE